MALMVTEQSESPPYRVSLNSDVAVPKKYF